jgi:hypothetical protein
VSFPLYTSENQYLKRTHKRETWYGATVFEALRGSQPFNAGAGLLHPLHILQFLPNTDKHRLLNIVAHNQVNLGGVTVVPEPAGGVRSTVNDGVVWAGSLLARAEFARPKRNGCSRPKAGLRRCSDTSISQAANVGFSWETR